MCSALDPIRFSPAWQVSDTSFTPLCRQSKFVSPELGELPLMSVLIVALNTWRIRASLSQVLLLLITFYHHTASSFPPDFGTGDSSSLFPTASNPNPVFVLLWGFLKCKFLFLSVTSSLLQPHLSTGLIKGTILGRQL